MCILNTVYVLQCFHLQYGESRDIDRVQEYVTVCDLELSSFNLNVMIKL